MGVPEVSSVRQEGGVEMEARVRRLVRIQVEVPMGVLVRVEMEATRATVPGVRVATVTRGVVVVDRASVGECYVRWQVEFLWAMAEREEGTVTLCSTFRL